MVPLYKRVRDGNWNFRRVLDDVGLQLGTRRYVFSIVAGTLPDSDAIVYFVHCPALYDRGSIYTNDADEHVRTCVNRVDPLRGRPHRCFVGQSLRRKG